MEIKEYLNIQLLASIFNLIIGLSMIFGLIPKNLRHTTFHRAQKSMGAAICVLPALTALFYFTDLKNANPYIITAIHLTGYYIISTLIVRAFFPFLEGDKKLRIRRYILDNITCIVIPLAMALAYTIENPTAFKHTVLVAAVLLFIRIVYIAIDYVNLYIKAENKLNNYYNDNNLVKITWLKRCMHLLFALGITCCVAAYSEFYSRWLGVIIIIQTLVTFIYIQYCFVSYIKRHQKLIKLQKETPEIIPPIKIITEEAKPVQLSYTNKEHIQTKLQNWMENKRYQQKNITILSVAAEIGTNRTYLSTYINQTYKVSFKNWITSLRIKEAKEMLSRNNKFTITEIADITGFQSLTSFTHVFTKATEKSPTQWRAAYQLQMEAQETEYKAAVSVRNLEEPKATLRNPKE